MDLFGGDSLGAAGCGALQVPKGELVLRVRSFPRHRIRSLIPMAGASHMGLVFGESYACWHIEPCKY